jgi:outer membrane protein assembly factor BamE (lipoprotein component of BamABCDE complex)
MTGILRRCFPPAVAVISTIFLAGCASQAPLTSATVPATAIAALSDGAIVPGERIGPVRLSGKIDEVVKLFGPGTVRERGTWGGLFVLQTWDAVGLWVIFDPESGNVIWISVEISGSNPWAEHSTPEGIRLGTRQQDLLSVMGSPERTESGYGGTSFYYDRRGIRFTVPEGGPFAGKVAALRVVWPSVPRGDTLIVPGRRISAVEVGMPVDQAVVALGGGYHKSRRRGSGIYYWPHLGLSFEERAGRVFAIRAASHIPADAPSIRYATMENLGRGSTASQIREIFGEPSKADLAKDSRSWTYRSRGIHFYLDDQQKVRLVDVFPPERR